MKRLAYSIQELTEQGGGGKTALYEAINAGTLKAKKRGSHTVILAADAEDYLANLPDYEPRPARAADDDPNGTDAQAAA